MLLLAFSFQNYVEQTHVHFEPADQALLRVLAAGRHATPATLQRAPHRKSPWNDDPANCPICQQVLLNGQFVTPAAYILPPPPVTVSTLIVVDRALAFVAAFSHSWQGRAPPSA